MVLKQPWAQKRLFWAFEKSIFHLFCKCLSDEVETIFWECYFRQSVKIYLIQNFGKGSFLENVFEATLSSKMNVLNVWKKHASVFKKFLSGEVENVFWESKAEC